MRLVFPWSGVDEDEAGEGGEGGRQAARLEYDSIDAFVSYWQPAASSFCLSLPFPGTVITVFSVAEEGVALLVPLPPPAVF